jgi:hypothetical protein
VRKKLVRMSRDSEFGGDSDAKDTNEVLEAVF